MSTTQATQLREGDSIALPFGLVTLGRRQYGHPTYNETTIVFRVGARGQDHVAFTPSDRVDRQCKDMNAVVVPLTAEDEAVRGPA